MAVSARRFWPLWLLLCLGQFAATASATPANVDPTLRQRLVAAMADADKSSDQFDAEVWLTDMSARLRRRLPDDSERLQLLKGIYIEAKRAHLPPELVLALIDVESNFDRFAISEAGAQGLMQVMPFWLKEIGHPKDNLFNQRTNLRMGCTILRYYMDMEKDNITRALARYNGSTRSYRYPQRVYDALRTRWYK